MIAESPPKNIFSSAYSARSFDKSPSNAVERVGELVRFSFTTIVMRLEFRKKRNFLFDCVYLPSFRDRKVGSHFQFLVLAEKFPSKNFPTTWVQ